MVTSPLPNNITDSTPRQTVHANYHNTLAEFSAGPAFYNIQGYGADPTDAALSTQAIDDALGAAGTAGGGIVFAPQGIYQTAGGHVVPAGVAVMGVGSWGTRFNHTGNNRLFTAGPEVTDIFRQRRFQGFRINGNAGASAGGILIQNVYHPLVMDVLSNGYAAGTDFELQNTDTYWTEGATFIHCHSRGSLKGWRFNVSGGTTSFAETRLIACTVVLQVANSVGLDLDGCYMYASDIQLKGNMEISSGTFIKLSNGANLHRSNRYATYIEGTVGTNLSVPAATIMEGTGFASHEAGITNSIAGTARFGVFDDEFAFRTSHLALKDAISPPAALVESATLYVDAADRTVKVKFADGVVVNIAAHP